MKLLLTTRMGDPYFGLLDDLPDVEKVWATTPDAIAREIVDADVVYGWPTLEQFQAAERLKWIQAPSAGVEMLCSIPEIVESDVAITNARGAHARVIAEHAFAMLLAFTRGLHRFGQDKAARRWSREAAIPDVLKKGKIAGAGLDVFEQEPLGSDSELWDVPNLIMTPHLAGASTQKDRRCVEILLENLERFRRGDTLINLVGKRKGY